MVGSFYVIFLVMMMWSPRCLTSASSRQQFKKQQYCRKCHIPDRHYLLFLKQYLLEIQNLGVNHVALNLRFNRDDMHSTLSRLADELLPVFQS